MTKDEESLSICSGCQYISCLRVLVPNIYNLRSMISAWRLRTRKVAKEQLAGTTKLSAILKRDGRNIIIYREFSTMHPYSSVLWINALFM